MMPNIPIYLFVSVCVYYRKAPKVNFIYSKLSNHSVSGTKKRNPPRQKRHRTNEVRRHKGLNESSSLLIMHGTAWISLTTYNWEVTNPVGTDHSMWNKRGGAGGSSELPLMKEWQVVSTIITYCTFTLPRCLKALHIYKEIRSRQQHNKLDFSKSMHRITQIEYSVNRIFLLNKGIYYRTCRLFQNNNCTAVRKVIVECKYMFVFIHTVD